MLKTILSISGRPGLFKLVSNSKNMVIVESLGDNKKMPIHARDRIVSLGDISIYTQEDEVLLKEIFCTMKSKEAGKECSVAANSKADDLRKYFKEVLPNYDEDRVHPSDMKKMINWYNLLINANIEFDKVEEVEDETETAVEA